MNTRIFSEDEQRIFRRVLDNNGAAKEAAVLELIEGNLDSEGAIINWLKRNNNYELYLKIKNKHDERIS